ncbi:(deoxy)nucleoside triphosphate pyrophosphohydrolase [Puniceicoccales bacterium CK1056]|uniref:8-oxo-dGTP diphosphatase n=1 Tax=Oceanipulchritudo coccoides TaxID=2706888 RepID=A0A6B2LY18_9BACT|nr:(deoxy)nucleoside triphosphate pyrophosphohydrolase [Oceanipulchritudo coccoides]NDV61508.1 (deoxy)nucleoside triphosphate pyrophosphohydrolase [Oceanipulchritudo coccoides]
MELKHLKVVCGIIVHKDRILATRRDPGRAFPLLWEFPGGKIEAGESGEEALHRELLEELSLKVKIVQPLEPVEHRENGHHLILIPFLCKPAQEQAPVLHEHVEMRWANLQELRRLEWAPADIPIVETLPQFLQSSS